jgi:hypothetical protein
VTINVDTSQVAAAAARVRPLAGGAESRAQAVTAVQRGLDLRIAASAHIEGRLRALSGSVASQAAGLNRHVAFLTWVSARYETAESTVRGGLPPGQAGYTRVAGSTTTAARQSGPGNQDEGGVHPPKPWNDAIREWTRDVLGADADVQEGWVDFVGAVPVVGTILGAQETIANAHEGGPGVNGLDLFLLVAGEGVSQGWGIPGLGTLTGLVQSYTHIVLSDQFQQGVVDMLPDSAIDFLASDANNAFVNAVSGVGAGISDVVEGTAKAAGGVWDWVNPW